MRTAKPSLSITKWLRTTSSAGREIPLQAECTACRNVQFQAPYNPRTPFHQPDRDGFYDWLRDTFEPSLESVRKQGRPSSTSVVAFHKRAFFVRLFACQRVPSEIFSPTDD